MKEGKVVYERVIEIEGVSKNELYTRTKNWSLSAFVSQKDALQLDDKEAGVIAYKSFFKIFSSIPFKGTTFSTEREFWHLIRILIKDNKAKIIISNVSVKEKYSGSFDYTSNRPIEEAFYAYDNPVETPKSVWLGKKFERDTKELIEKQKKEFITDCIKAHAEFESTISLIKDYIQGTKKAHLDF
jgi:hypothetical protein